MATVVQVVPMVQMLGREWAAVDEMCASLCAEQFATPTCLPGWTVQDQLAHLAGVELMLDGVAAPEVDVSHLTHVLNDVARMGEVWVEDMRTLSGPEVLEVFRQVTARRLAALRAMTQTEFDAPSWTPVGADETYGRFMRIRHFDTFMHEHDIRQALTLADRAEPDEVASALSEIEPSLGYIVGRRASMPDGSRVAIRLTGPVERTYRVLVDGRARVVEDESGLGGEPTVSLTMPTMLFLRLAGGRMPAGPHIGGDLLLGGDHELAHHLAEHLTFTI